MKFRAAVAMLFAGVICAALLRQAPDILDRPLLGGTPGGHNALPLTAVAEGGRVTRAATLHAADLAALAAYDEVRLLVGTYDTSPRLDEGTIALSGSCLFRAASQRLSENTVVRFRRQGDCSALPREGDLTLRLTFAAASARDARAALWTSPVNATDLALMTGTSAGDTFAPVGRARITRGPAGTSRSQLLQYLWDLPSWVFWGTVAIAALLLVTGAVFAGHTARPSAAAAAFLLGSGFALFYAVIVPPLQAPDEPDHLLGFATLSARPDLAAATSSWAKRIHFYRITFMADERFTPADREQPFASDWPAEVFAENVRHRSSTATRFWQALTPLVPTRPPHALLFLRIAQSLVFGAALAVGAALLAGPGVAGPAIPALVLLAMPTLPFFGMQLSELTFTIGAFVLVGHTCLLLRHGASGRLTGPVLGLAVALIAAGPRSGWPALLFIAAAGLARIVSDPEGTPRTLADAAWFWGGLVAPALVLLGTGLLWIPSPFYEQWHLDTFDPRTGLSAGTFLLGLAAGAGAGFAAEWLVRLAPALPRALGFIARVFCAVGALGILATFMWSAFAPLPVLPTVESVPFESALDYVRAVLLPLATAARFRGFDFLTWTTLWGGFGWADAILPAAAIAVATVFALGTAAITLARDARNGDGRAALLTVSGVLGLAGGIAAAAYSSYGLHRNMHGRYLLGAAVVGLCLLTTPALLAGRRVSNAGIAAVLLSLCCGLHAFSLMFLLEKYFG